MQRPGLLPLNQNSQKHGPLIIGPCQKVVPLYIGKLTTVFVFIVYIDKKDDNDYDDVDDGGDDNDDIDTDDDDVGYYDGEYNAIDDDDGRR